MNRNALSIVIAAGLCVAACGNAPPAAETEEGARNIQALNGLRQGIDEVRIDEVDPEAIDASAQNINPFKYGLDYTIYERDLLEDMLESARNDPDYLNRSFAATRESLPVVRPGKSWDDYHEALTCAVSADVFGRVGGMVPHQALDHAINFTELAITITASDMETPDFHAFEERMADLQENGTALDRFNARRELEAEENRLRTRHYLNYFLLRDGLLDAPDEAALQADVERCVSVHAEDLAALIAAREAAEAEAENG